MKFQRLPLVYTGAARPAPANPPPESLLYTSVAQMSPLGEPTTDVNPTNLNTLAIIALSDYHILDCPPTVHGRAAGTAAINDYSRQPTQSDFQFLTSLNHIIRFHAHEGFRADEVIYVEANCPWTKGRRAQVDSRIFSGEGKLLATCAQEAYFVMKEEGEQTGERTWVMEDDDSGMKSKL